MYTSLLPHRAADSGSPYSDAVTHLVTKHASTSPFISTVLLLMSEVARGEASPFSHYIK